MSEELNQVIDLLGDSEEPQRASVMEAVLEDLDPVQIALLLEALPQEQRENRWHEIPLELQRQVLVEMRAEVRSSVIRFLSEEQLNDLISNLEAQDLIELAESLPEEIIEDALRQMDTQQREYFDRASQYDEGQVGRFVEHELLMLPASLRVQDADRLLRRELPAYTDSLFLYDRSGRYTGTVRTAQLYTIPGHHPLSGEVDEDAACLAGDSPLFDAAETVLRSGWSALPVVDEQNRLLGRLTLKQAMEIQREHYEGQLMAGAGLNEEEDLFAPVLRSSRRRATWLGINLLTAFLASWAIGLFEATLQQVVALAVLMPIVASMGGIAGSQTLTLMIRGLALNQISRGNLWLLLKKELSVAVVNGLIWAAVIALIAAIWFSSPALGGVIGIAIAVNILAAALSGVMIPMVLDRLKIDPALSGSVVLTTVTDVVGFVTFSRIGGVGIGLRACRRSREIVMLEKKKPQQ